MRRIVIFERAFYDSLLGRSFLELYDFRICLIVGLITLKLKFSSFCSHGTSDGSCLPSCSVRGHNLPIGLLGEGNNLFTLEVGRNAHKLEN